MQDVPAGEELSISYFPMHLELLTRQQRCQQLYGFSCRCMRCKVLSFCILRGSTEQVQYGCDVLLQPGPVQYAGYSAAHSMCATNLKVCMMSVSMCARCHPRLWKAPEADMWQHFIWQQLITVLLPMYTLHRAASGAVHLAYNEILCTVHDH